MSLHPHVIAPVPEETARVARAAFPKGQPYLTFRDALKTIFQDEDFTAFFHTPSNLVVAHWTSDVENTAPLGVLLRHNLWIPSWCLISCKIRSIISVTCDFTTK